MKSRILPVIAASFGVLFLLKATNVAFAAPDKAAKKTPAPVETSQTVHPDAAVKSTRSEGDVCLTVAMAESVSRDREAIDLKKIDLETRDKALKALEVRLNAQLDTINAAKADLQKQAEALNTIASEDLNHLVTMYSTMKPKQAAEIFDNMDPAFAAGFLREINSTKAGLIMAQMNTKNSYKVSLLIASRNAQWRPDSTAN